MPADTNDTVPVLVYLDRKDWLRFKKKAGKRKASMRLRQLIRADVGRRVQG